MNRRRFFRNIAARPLLPAAGVLLTDCSSGPRLNVYNWSDYVAPETIPQLRARIRRARSLRHVRKQSGDAGAGDERQFRLGRGVSVRRFRWADARPGIAGADSSRPAAKSGRPRCRSFSVRPGTRSLHWSVPYMHGVTGILYQKSLHRRRSRGRICGTRVCAGRSPCWTTRRKYSARA